MLSAKHIWYIEHHRSPRPFSLAGETASKRGRMWEERKWRGCAESQEAERWTQGLCNVTSSLFLLRWEKELLHFREIFLTILCTASLFKKPINNPESGKTLYPKWRAFILAYAALGTRYLSNGKDSSREHLLEIYFFPISKPRNAYKSNLPIVGKVSHK